MHSQPLPTVVAVSPGSGDGGAEGSKRGDFSPKLNLELGIGSWGLEGRKRIKLEKKEPLFSAAQFHDFCNQIAVYNSIVLGLPLSFHLLLPVWMSALNSLGPDINKKYPSFSGPIPHSSDQSSAMDPEPGRCRRTDGRKWRCSKNVLPCQKYCERHMHRGRQGSRKLVEPIESAVRHDNMTTDDTTKLRIMSYIASDIDARIVLNQNRPYCNYRNDDEYHDDILAVRTSDDAFDVGSEVKKNSYGASACSKSKNNFTTNEGNLSEGKFNSDDANPRKIGATKQSVGRSNCIGFVSPRFGSSPKSVLHCAAGKVNDSKNVKEPEIMRCRRTDGKRWQCRRDALPNQKYCESHMHRGAKKVLNPHSVGNSLATCSMRAQSSRTLDNGINLNTVPASPQYIATTSSTSDATTITDENISFRLSHSLRNC